MNLEAAQRAPSCAKRRQVAPPMPPPPPVTITVFPSNFRMVFSAKVVRVGMLAKCICISRYVNVLTYNRLR
jgi:hypothetical protein